MEPSLREQADPRYSSTSESIPSALQRPRSSYTLEKASTGDSRKVKHNSLSGIMEPKEEPEIGQTMLSSRHTSDTSAEGQVTNEAANPFGEESGEGVKYRTMKWWHAGLLLVAETVSLGILSLPQVFAVLGYVAGILLVVGFGVTTSYTGYVVFQFKRAYPQCHNFADAGTIICGPVGRWVGEVCQILMLIFIMAAHVLTFSVMMNVLTDHATCTIVFTIVGTIVSLILTLPRTLKNLSYFSIFSCLSITASIIITMIGVGIRQPGIDLTYAVTPSNLTSWQAGVVAVSNIVVAYTGHIAFFGIVSELKEPKGFPMSLLLLQTVAISFYITVAVVIYYYAGINVTSPAIGSASPVVRKVAFGIAIPTIVIAGVINAHICVKNIYVHFWRKTNVMSEKSFRSYGSWALLCLITWIVAWTIASAIPVFSQLIGLIGALFCSWFSLGFPAMFWLHLNKERYFANWKKALLLFLNVGILVMCFAVCGLGTYSSALEIANTKGNHGAFSCANNSGLKDDV